MIIRYLVTVLFGIIFSFSVFPQTEKDFFGKLRTVVIDAGHGGKDKGCLGSHSYEKDVALAVSLKLGKYLEENFENLNVIYTRKTDVFVELDERAKIANRAKADLFICIHANSAANSAAFGTETFVMGNAKSQSNMKTMQRENSVILLEDNYEEKYENFDPYSPESYIAMSITQSVYQNQSIAFAEKIQKQFRERVGRRDRGVKMDHFLVLHRTTMPSVLIETGFLTNANEQKFLMSELGQDYLASAVFRAFREYKEELEGKAAIMIDQKIKEEVEGGNQVQSKNESKKNEETKTSKERQGKKELVFKVQLATTTTKLETTASNFKGLDGVDFYEAGGLFRYTYGKERSWEAANRLQEEVKKSGFQDAFVIAFYGNKRIAVGEAVKILKQHK